MDFRKEIAECNRVIHDVRRRKLENESALQQSIPASLLEKLSVSLLFMLGVLVLVLPTSSSNRYSELNLVELVSMVVLFSVGFSLVCEFCYHRPTALAHSKLQLLTQELDLMENQALAYRGLLRPLDEQHKQLKKMRSIHRTILKKYPRPAWFWAGLHSYGYLSIWVLFFKFSF